MRFLIPLGFAFLITAAAQAERPRLFPRLHARLHPRQCVPVVPSCPPVSIAEAIPEPPKKSDAPAKKYPYVAISGSVHWPGNLAIPPVKIVNVAPAAFPFGPVAINNLLIEPETRGVKNVIVWLRPDDNDRTHTFPLDKVHPEFLWPRRVPENHVIRVKDGQFDPRILTARAGDTLRFANSSPVRININYNSDLEQFNANLPVGGEKKLAKHLEAQRSVINVACNIHPWMVAKARVFDHPYYAITDEHGHFEIRDVPVGKWRIVYQHELGYHNGKAGLLGFPVDLKDDKETMEIEPVLLELPKP